MLTALGPGEDAGCGVWGRDPLRGMEKRKQPEMTAWKSTEREVPWLMVHLEALGPEKGIDGGYEDVGPTGIGMRLKDP